MFCAVPMFAQGGRQRGGRRQHLGSGDGRILDGDRFRPLCARPGQRGAGAAEGMARNPGSFRAIRFALILGLVLIESLALYTFAIIFVKVQ